MIVNGLTYISGLDNAAQGCKNLYNKEYGSAAKNFMEAAIRGTMVSACALVAYSVLNPPDYGGPANQVSSFCNFGGAQVRELCMRDVFNKFPEKAFEAIISNPWKMKGQVMKYCNAQGFNYNDKCWELISNNTKVLERLSF